MAGSPGLAGTDNAFHAGSVKVTPATTARQARITRRLALGIFSLITICNLSWARLVRTSVLVDAVDGVVAVVG
jgi:hypothetical protein